MSKRNRIVERASDVNGGQYIQTNSSYNSGYEDGKKAGKEYCASVIESLREQVEKLTMERDTEIARNRPLQSLIKSTEETKSFLLKKSEENKEAVKQLDSERQANALLTEELAALAEQNEKMRKVLLRLACLGNGDQYGNSIGNCIAQEALSLPDLATPVLNRIKAEAYREAAMHCSKHGRRTADEVSEDLFANADELEQSK